MRFNEGDRVKIMLNTKEQIPSVKEVQAFQGHEAAVSKKKIIHYGRGNATIDVYYELEGVNSKMGIPFAFLEAQLVPAEE